MAKSQMVLQKIAFVINDAIALFLFGQLQFGISGPPYVSDVLAFFSFSSIFAQINFSPHAKKHEQVLISIKL